MPKPAALVLDPRTDFHENTHHLLCPAGGWEGGPQECNPHFIIIQIRLHFGCIYGAAGNQVSGVRNRRLPLECRSGIHKRYRGIPFPFLQACLRCSRQQIVQVPGRPNPLPLPLTIDAA